MVCCVSCPEPSRALLGAERLEITDQIYSCLRPRPTHKHVRLGNQKVPSAEEGKVRSDKIEIVTKSDVT